MFQGKFSSTELNTEKKPIVRKRKKGKRGQRYFSETAKIILTIKINRCILKIRKLGYIGAFGLKAKKGNSLDASAVPPLSPRPFYFRKGTLSAYICHCSG